MTEWHAQFLGHLPDAALANSIRQNMEATEGTAYLCGALSVVQSKDHSIADVSPGYSDGSQQVLKSAYHF